MRALKVERFLRELEQLKREAQHNGCWSYSEMKEAHPEFLVFEVADQYRHLQEPLGALAENRRVVWIAKKLAAAHTGKADQTIDKDWKRHKPSHRRPNAHPRPRIKGASVRG
jgi:hypothetical protein